MLSIGERLQQARQQQNLSLEDIATKLNIGSDILSKFEANDFSCQLPTIYNRGFLLTYAKFLHLNTAEIATLYDQLTEGGKEVPLTPLKHLQFDANDTAEDRTPDETLKSSAFLGNRQWKLPPLSQKQWIAIGIAAILGLFLLIKGCHSSEPPAPEAEPETASGEPPVAEDSQTFFETESNNEETQVLSRPSAEPIVEEQLTLIASDTVKIVVRRERDQKTLFSGTLHGGAQQSIEKKETLQILFSDGDHFTIARANGTLVRPQTPGRGLVRIQ
jgi:cytoskeletal protein RodZ